jgi:hypothetical protein
MKISETAQKLLQSIINENDAAAVAPLANWFDCESGWNELTESGLINVWTDDSGTVYVEAK